MKRSDFFEYQDNFARNNNVGSTLLYGCELNTTPFISITIPTFRRPKLLREAVDSVLQQNNFSDYEIVIIDNDSDKLYADQIISFLTELADIRIRYYINEKNIGVFGNWNRCIELARGTWMTILCDDDILFNNYLSVLTQELEQDPSLNRIECRYLRFSDSKNLHPTAKKRWIFNFVRKIIGNECLVNYKMYVFGCYTVPHSQLYKRELAYKLGGFNPIYAPISDYVFNAAYLYYFPNGLYKNVYLCGYRWAVNESQRKIVRVGLYRWNKVFRKFLLAKNRSLFKQCTTMWLDYAELKLLDRDSSILRKLIMFVGTRVFNFCCLCAKVPLPFG